MPGLLKSKLRILPLGGLGEVGMNCMVIEYADEMILIDCGIQFPDASYNGVDILIPDLSYVKARLDKLKAIVVTHGHDDHIGAIPYLAREKDIDVYVTPFPQGLIKQKLEEFKDVQEIRFHEIEPRKKFKIGSFSFDPIPVQHSIIEALAFAIETPIGTVIHSGDFKHDPLETSRGKVGLEAFEQYGKKGVLLLMSDSTNAERAGHTLSEVDIAKSFEKIFKDQSSRIVIALFASNIRRIEKLLQTAHKQKKKVALIGRSMHGYTRLAHDQESLNIPEDTLILAENTHQYPDDKVVILATGSQAEPQSALLRISQGIHKEFKLKEGDQVILSSRFIPGNERNISSMIDHLYRQGAEVLYESIHQIHVSGHGFQEELLMLLKATKPKFFIPIHGAYRHLAKHSNLARQAKVKPENVKVIEDGQAVVVTEDSIELAEKLELQKAAVVEGKFVESAPTIFTQRNNLAKTGIVFAVIMRRADNKSLITSPAIHTYGLLYLKGENATETAKLAEERLAVVYNDAKQSSSDLTETVRLEMRRFFRKHASHKPVVMPLIVDL